MPDDVGLEVVDDSATSNVLSAASSSRSFSISALNTSLAARGRSQLLIYRPACRPHRCSTVMRALRGGPSPTAQSDLNAYAQPGSRMPRVPSPPGRGCLDSKRQ